MESGVKEHVDALLRSHAELLIVFAGDSHTWGQGADGWREALKPCFVAGEWRRLPVCIPSFAQLFHDYLKKLRPAPKNTYAINSGYGCASTKIYLRDYWFHAVEVYRPDIVVLEFAINDWIASNDVSVQEFGENLNVMISRCLEIGSAPILLTVSPINGSQWSGNNLYQDYINCIYSVAKDRPEAILADAHALMKHHLSQGGSLFYDDWHVNQKGQELYCQALAMAVNGSSVSTELLGKDADA